MTQIGGEDGGGGGGGGVGGRQRGQVAIRDTWWGGERGEKGDVGGESWSEVGVGSRRREGRHASGLPPHLL